MQPTLVKPEARAAEPYRWRWLALFVVLGAEVMDLLDALVTNIAAPSIRADLGGSLTLIQWLGAAYTISMAIGLLTGGRLGDMYGRKRMFLVGAVGFTAASLLCGLAQSPEWLIGGRVLQGLLGAIMLPQGLGLIKEMFPPKEMAAAFGAFGPVMGLSSVGGPVLAGWLIDADFFDAGWRMIFWINLPLGLFILIAGVRLLPEHRVEPRPKLDLPGVALAAAGGGLLVYPLVQGRELGWPAWTFGLIGAAIAVFGLFGWYEARRQRRGADPLVVVGLFRRRAFTGGMIAGLAFFAALIGFSLVFTLYLQVGLGWSPLKAGLSGLPVAIGSVAGFVVAGAGLAEKLGRLLLHIGAIVMGLGLIGLLFTVQHTGADVTPWQLIPGSLAVGVGMGFTMAPFFNIVLAGVEPHETGSASGTMTAMQQLGGALGIAILGTMFFGLLPPAVVRHADATAPGLRTTLTVAGVPAGQQRDIVAGVRACLHDRAANDDPAREPASCRQAQPAQGDPVGLAISGYAERAVQAGFRDAMSWTLWGNAALLALTFLLAFLLPKRARAENESS
jgi:EmrB/QacA subfamily drug resistance transporter